MAKKNWRAVAEERKQYPGVPLLVTKPDPSTSLNLTLLEKLKAAAEKEGLVAEIKYLRTRGRTQGLWVTWPADPPQDRG